MALVFAFLLLTLNSVPVFIWIVNSSISTILYRPRWQCASCMHAFMSQVKVY